MCFDQVQSHMNLNLNSGGLTLQQPTNTGLYSYK
jgi:hypothetical protein